MRFNYWLSTLLVVTGLCDIACVSDADAATVYRCVGKDGAIAFQDRACGAGGKQSVLDIVSHDPPISVSAVQLDKSVRAARPRATTARRSRVTDPTSFECRTNTGMVFYRHSRCPASLVDGIDANGKSRRLTVSSQGMERREACRRMRNGARDGNQFDDRVSTYERNLGRDTCRNY